RQAVDQRLLRQRLALDYAVGRALGRRVADLRARVAAEAALTADEQREAVREQRLSVVRVLRVRLHDHERGFPFVVDLGNVRARRELRFRGKWTVQDHLL